MFLDARVGPDIVTLASLALVVLPVDSLGEDTVRMKSNKALFNNVLLNNAARLELRSCCRCA